MKKTIYLLLLLFSYFAATNAQISRYVKVTATGAGDGTSWANAAGTANIQTIIDQVAADANQGTVYFAAGTYLIGAQIQMKNNVQMMGGYAADGSGTRDLLNNQTILDGQFNKRIIFTGDQSPNVAFTKITKLDGFVLQRGSSSYGSAAAISIGTVLENCIIRNNNGSTQGAAVFIKRHATISSPTAGWNMASALINCVIVNNTSSNLAAAIFTNDDSHFNVINCTIANNKSTDATGGVGGLLFAKNIRYARVANNIFYNNSSPVSGRNNFYHTGTDALAAIFNNYFSDSSFPNTNITAANGNKLSTDVSNPSFKAVTGFLGYDATKMSEIASTDWRLTSASGLIGLGSTASGRADITYPYSSPYFNNAARAFTTVTSDVQGSSRVINTTVEMGAYEYNPVTVTTATANPSKGTVSASTTVSKGSSVSITATASSGCLFTNWTDASNNIVSSSPTYTFVPTSDITLTANFLQPSISVSKTSLTDINGTPDNNTSAAYQQEFNVSGSDLTGDIVISAPTNFQISTLGANSFNPVPTISLSSTNGVVASTTIYVRSACLTQGTFSENITLTSTNATTKTVSCSGFVDLTVGSIQTTNSDPIFSNHGKQLVISNVKIGDLIVVYNGFGQKIYSSRALKETVMIQLYSNSFHLIKVGNKIKKLY